jgi:hypothetical protein
VGVGEANEVGGIDDGSDVGRSEDVGGKEDNIGVDKEGERADVQLSCGAVNADASGVGGKTTADFALQPESSANNSVIIIKISRFILY